MGGCRRLLGIFLAALLVGVVQPQLGWAEEETDRVQLMLGKLGRGVSNIVTSPLELLRVPTLVKRKDGYFAGSTIGVFQGAWQGIRRAAVGIFEVASFYLEIPEDYGPIVSPEFVLAHGAWGGN